MGTLEQKRNLTSTQIGQIGEHKHERDEEGGTKDEIDDDSIYPTQPR
jgi:hypothetical protein